MGRSDIGPKAASLVSLRAAGLPVPEARFLDAAAYREHAARAGVPVLLAVDPVDASAVREALERTPIEPALEALLRDWHRELGDGGLAVRSSGTAEDLAGASFAGQHGTYFVVTADELVARVRDCWASLFGERAAAYREEHDVGHADVAMGVIVQRLVDARSAGVVFTADPVTGALGRVLVESCAGLGEALVSGKVSPDRRVFARDGLALVESSDGGQRVRVARDPDGSVHEEAIETAVTPVHDDVAREAARLALAAEAHVGAPVDVEWAWDGSTVWLLQSRPITTLAATARRQEPPSDGARPTIWSNVNTGEILPDVISPMTWSIIHGRADDIFAGMFGALGVRIDADRIVGLVGGRVYFNLSMLRESFANFPGIDADTALGGLHDFVELPPPAPTRGRPPFLALARAAVRLPVYVVRHRPGRAGAFAARMRSISDAAEARVATRPGLGDAHALVVSLVEEFGRFSEALAFMAVAMLGFGMLAGLTKRWLGDETGALANRLVAGSGDVASADAGHALWRLSSLARGHTSVTGPLLTAVGWDDARSRLETASGRDDTAAAEFLAAWDAFMREHGHHRRGELELANATWAERPDYVLGVVRGYLVEHAESDPLGAYAARAADAEHAVAEVLASLRGVRRMLFRRVLAWGRASARSRENIKSEAVRWLVAIRHALLALGERLVEAGTLERADDIFYLEYGEVDAAVRGEDRDRAAMVAARRADHARLETLSPPPVVVGTWDEGAETWAPAVASRTLRGITVSAGTARGYARVFASADTDEQVLPGEILVAPFTDPGWTPYFVPAAGIVMDLGGLLSHGSIIAREYGIPAVVNVGPATRIIHTGDLIEVDGERGEVRILS